MFPRRLINLLRPLQLRGAGRLFHRVTPHCGEYDIDVAPGVSMSVRLENGQQRQMFMGCFARDVQQPIRRLLRAGDTFVDIGANVGFMTLLAAHRVGPRGRVLAFEPYPPTYEVLRRNVARNALNHVTTMQAALSSEAGTLRLFVPPAEAHREFNVSMIRSPQSVPADVPARPLDDCIAELGWNRIDLMKVDVEGAEPFVFRGGLKSLSAGVVRHLICEVNGKYLVQNDSSPARLLAQIADLGFVMARLAGRSLVPLKRRPTLADSDEIDALFVHRSALHPSPRSRGEK